MEAGVPARLSAGELRKFAFVVGGAFLALAALMWWRERTVAAVVLAAPGAALILAGAVVPSRLHPVYRGWMGFAIRLSKITTPIFLGVVYFLVITPMGLLRRTFGRNPLVHSAGESGFWRPRTEGERRGVLDRQF